MILVTSHSVDERITNTKATTTTTTTTMNWCLPVCSTTDGVFCGRNVLEEVEAEIEDLSSRTERVNKAATTQSEIPAKLYSVEPLITLYQP